MTLKILIVEDDAIVQKVLKKQVEGYGQPVIAASAEQARDVLFSARSKDKHFPLALIDIGLPEEDGLDLLTAIRLYESENNLEPMAVIMVTGSNEGADIAQARSLNVFAYVMKPISTDELQNQLEAALSRHR